MVLLGWCSLAHVIILRHQQRNEAACLFPHAPMLGPAGGVEPCEGGGAIHGDVGALCQNRTIAPMHDPALGPRR